VDVGPGDVAAQHGARYGCREQNFMGSPKMAKPDVAALRGQIVQLIIQQGAIHSNWVKFAITVQGGLVAGLGFVLSDVTKYRLLGFLVAIFGGATAILFAVILNRHNQWVRWYVRRCNNLAAIPKIVPDIPGEVRKQGTGVVGWAVTIFLFGVAIAWGWIFIMILHERAPVALFVGKHVAKAVA